MYNFSENKYKKHCKLHYNKNKYKKERVIL